MEKKEKEEGKGSRKGKGEGKGRGLLYITCIQKPEDKTASLLFLRCCLLLGTGSLTGL